MQPWRTPWAKALMQDVHSMLPGTLLHDGSDAQAEAEALVYTVDSTVLL